MDFSLKGVVREPVVSEALGVDLGSSGLKLIWIRRGKEGYTLVNADVLPPLKLELASEKEEDRKAGGPVLPLPREWRVTYAGMAVSSPEAVVRFLSLTGKAADAKGLEGRLREHLGLEKEYRLGFVRMGAGSRREGEVRILAAALPEAEVAGVLSLVESGIPAAASVQIASLAGLDAFATWGPPSKDEGAIGYIACEARGTLLAFFNGGELALARQFPLGGDRVAELFEKKMRVTRDVALRVIQEGSFDISQFVTQAAQQFLQQLSISRDFVERREECHVTRFYLCGGMAMSSYWVDCVRSAVAGEVIVWNPLECIGATALPEKLQGQEARFAAAVGAAMGVLET